MLWMLIELPHLSTDKEHLLLNGESIKLITCTFGLEQSCVLFPVFEFYHFVQIMKLYSFAVNFIAKQ